MNSFDTIFMKADISDMKLNHIWESAYDSFNIHVAEIFNSTVIEESTKEIMYEESVRDLAKKAGEIIQKIIDAIKDVCLKLKKVVTEKFLSKETKNKLNEAEEALKKNPSLGKEKVEIMVDKASSQLLDQYIKDMAKLERELLYLKVETDDRYGAFDSKKVNMAEVIFRVNQISKKMDALNNKYDSVVGDNEKLIQMALSDAIRFNSKQLDNIKIDYDAVEKNASEVLREFKTDASGCDVPVKYNLIQKMANAIGTRVRKYFKKKTEYHKNNLFKIVAAVSVGAAIGYTKHKLTTDPKNFPKNLITGPKDLINAAKNGASQVKNAVQP